MGKEKHALLRAISAYVPPIVARQAISTAHVLPAGQAIQMQAALLFADISGFTTMSESLAGLGKEGAEELTRILNGYFSTMIDVVHAYGGQVIKFGGDAITCAFAGSRTCESTNSRMCDLETEIVRACACALAMQSAMAAFRTVETRGGAFELRMKIGVSAGPVQFLDVGDPEQGLEYVLAGRPLDRMAAAEHRAAAGEVVVDGECLAGMGKGWGDLGIIPGTGRDGFLPVRAMTRPVETAEPDDVNWDRLSDGEVARATARLVPHLPPAVYERLVDGQWQFVGEHRRVVSLFVNFFGLDYDADPQVGHKLQRYFTAMQQVIHRYGGRLNRLMTGDKGSLLHLIFGAPVAHEDDERRALACALEMQHTAVRADGLPFIADQRIGVASGHVFAGDVGSECRREYTVMGDVVNLSARLMQAAGTGEILVERETARRAAEEFTCQELTPITVKGKRDPVPVCRVVGIREEAKIWGAGEAEAGRRRPPIVGRERELVLIDEIIARAAAGRGQLLVITGEAGVGKSRLLEELIALANEQEEGLYGLGGDCVSYGSRSPYLPWIDFFTSFFGLSTDAGEKHEDRARSIEQRMAGADPALAGWMPLMGQLLGLPVPDNERTAPLDAQLRKQRTFDLALALLRHQAQQVPLFLIVFEDVHWMDAISLELLNHVARNIADYRILLVAIHRPTIDLAEWRRYGYCNVVDLTDLPAEDALRLVRAKLAMSEIPGSLRDHVLRGEARVNPFFVEEVINSLIDGGYLVSRGRDGPGYELAGDLAQVAIPDSVQALVMSRIDRLDESSKLTVKVASVIGRTFKYRPLQAIYPVEITPQRLRRNLERLSRLDLTPLDRPAPEWEYIFKHIITQEVAYESLLYAHRRELHHRMGAFLERTYSDSLEERYELLAHHYHQSGDREKSWDYLVKAGDKARARYANEAAIAYYVQALALDSAREGTYRVCESLGDVYRLIGQYDEALASYRDALECHPPAATQVAEIRRKIAKTWELQGRYEEAAHDLDLARDALQEGRPPRPGSGQAPRLGSGQAMVEMARVYGDMGWVAMRRGDYAEAFRDVAEGLDVAKRLPRDDSGHRVTARLQHTLGSIYWQTGDYAQAIAHFQACIEMQERTTIWRPCTGAKASTTWRPSTYSRASASTRESATCTGRRCAPTTWASSPTRWVIIRAPSPIIRGASRSAQRLGTRAGSPIRTVTWERCFILWRKMGRPSNISRKRPGFRPSSATGWV